MKLKKVLSGVIAAAMLATTTAIVMPLEASAVEDILPITGITYKTPTATWGALSEAINSGNTTFFDNITEYATISIDFTLTEDGVTRANTAGNLNNVIKIYAQETEAWGCGSGIQLSCKTTGTYDSTTTYTATGDLTSLVEDAKTVTKKTDIAEALAICQFNIQACEIYGISVKSMSFTEPNGSAPFEGTKFVIPANSTWNYQGIKNLDLGAFTANTLQDFIDSVQSIKTTFKANGAVCGTNKNYDVTNINYQFSIVNANYKWTVVGSSTTAADGTVTVTADNAAIKTAIETMAADEAQDITTLQFTGIQLVAMIDLDKADDEVTLYHGDITTTIEEVEAVAPTGVTVTPATLALKVGDAASALTATVVPAEAAQDVVWASSNTKVATVSTDGKVTAVATGTAKITATAKDTDPAVVGECTVTVTNPATAITIDETASVLVDAEKTLAVTTTPADADELTYTWTSSNPEIATVTNGVVKGIAAGEAVITVKAGALEDTCTVTVTAEAKPITKLEISEATLELEEGKTGTLTSTATPADTTDEIEWITSDANVATVKDGVVTAVAEGKATITVQVKGNSAISASCEVTVTKPADPEPPAEEQPEQPTTPTESSALWEGTQAMASDWSTTIEISKDKLASVKAGDTLVIEVSKFTSGAQISVKTKADGWPAIPAFTTIDPEWGCDSVTKAGTYSYVLTAEDVAALKANDTIVGGHDYTVTSVKLIAAAEEPAEETKYETGKVVAVEDYDAPVGTELFVMSITENEAKSHNAYNVTVKVGEKSKTVEVTKCYGGFAFKGTDGKTQTVKAANGYFIVVKVTGLKTDEHAVITMAPVTE